MKGSNETQRRVVKFNGFKRACHNQFNAMPCASSALGCNAVANNDGELNIYVIFNRCIFIA